MLYWVNGIATDSNKQNPWLWACYSGVESIEKAKSIIDDAKDSLNLLSAWIDVFDENNNKTTVYHECFI